MKHVAAVHKQEYGIKPGAISAAPGTVPLFGEHSHGIGGRVMLSAIREKVAVAVSKRRDSAFHFFEKSFDERKKSTALPVKWRKEDRWANLCKAVVHAFHQRGIDIPGIDFTIVSEVPVSIGLGYSSALCVATAHALNKLLHTAYKREQVIKIAIEADSVFQQKRANTAAVVAASHARQGYVLVWHAETGKHEQYPFFTKKAQLIWIHPNVPLAEDQDSNLHNRFEEAYKCFELFDFCPYPSNEGLLRSSTEEYQDVPNVSGDIRRSCKHLHADEKRISEAVQALQQRDYSRFGQCLYRSHESLRDLCEISVPEIDWLVRRKAEIHGVFGGRRCGVNASAGIVILIDPACFDDCVDKLHEYERIFGFHADYIRVIPGGGVRIR